MVRLARTWVLGLGLVTSGEAADGGLRGPKSSVRLLQVQSSSCSAYPACVDLVGECCPASDGKNLTCCGVAQQVASAPLLAAAPMQNISGLPSPSDDWWITRQPTTPSETDCLMDHKFGCYVIKHQTTCLGSKDGRPEANFGGLRIHGQPCVWCGGGACHDGASNLCEPLDYLMRGQGKVFTTFFAKASYQVAKCEGNEPLPPTNVFRSKPLPPVPTPPPWWIPQGKPAGENLTCLSQTLGCSNITTMGQCLSSRDGSDLSQTQDGLNVRGEPCVWCNGMHCTSNSSSMCEPFDYVMRGEGLAFGLFHAKTSFTVASCVVPEGKRILPAGADFSCLKDVPDGCSALTDAASCLSSRDGRPNLTINGLLIRDEPCVWCGGVPCTSKNANTCEPFDYLVNGAGRAFVSFEAVLTYRLAACKNGKAAAISTHGFTDVVAGYSYDPLKKAPLVPFWVSNRPSAEQTKCLKPHVGGCVQIKDMATCMSSSDGGSIPSIQGLRVQGEPCVWCGGIPCTSKSDSLCGPFDYLMNGEPKAFATFNAKGVYKVADCFPGVTHLPPYEYSCLEPVAKGCSAIWNAEECLASRDDRPVSMGALRVHRQPCVWCGGGRCHSGNNSLCEPFDYLLNGEGKAFTTLHARSNYRLAACMNNSPVAATLTSNFTSFVPGYTWKPRPLPTVPPRPKYWIPARPTKANMSCLKYYDDGCSAIKSMGLCLSSRDGSLTSNIKNLSVTGEPCVWCGGGLCHSNGTSYCEPFDYLMRGEGTAFAIFYAPSTFKVAGCQESRIPLPSSDRSCLKTASSGCSALRDADSCLRSKDGRSDLTLDGLRVHDEPCVWCGGVACHSKNGNLCEPFDYAMNGEGKAFNIFHAKGVYRFAGCMDGYPAAMDYSGHAPIVQGYNPFANSSHARLVPSWVASRPKPEDLGCLQEYRAGCSAITEMKVCLSSSDGSSTPEISGYKVRGEPCVYCNGLPCTSNSSSLCGPFDLLMHGEGDAFTTFSAKGSYKVAGCRADVSKPPYDYSCLEVAPSGCQSIRNPWDCLKSMDGRPNATLDGLKVHNEPCVWCGGGLCHSGNDNMCEPFDYVMNGKGRAFNLFHAKLTYRIAACSDGQPRGATLENFTDFVPGAIPTIQPEWWVPEKPKGEELDCLMNHTFGCFVIKHKETCLGSRDARHATTLNGLKVNGEPCVWCGGGLCHTGGSNLCEPFDFLMHGEGKAFSSFTAKHSFQVARCSDGKPVTSASEGVPSLSVPSIARDASVGAAVEGAGVSATLAGTPPVQEAEVVTTTVAAARDSIAGEDCWYECGERGGQCSWCGEGRACCRDGWSSNPSECLGVTSYTTSLHHECVAVATLPTLAPATAATIPPITPISGGATAGAGTLGAAAVATPIVVPGQVAGSGTAEMSTTAALPAQGATDSAAVTIASAATITIAPAATITIAPAATISTNPAVTTAPDVALPEGPAVTLAPATTVNKDPGVSLAPLPGVPAVTVAPVTLVPGALGGTIAPGAMVPVTSASTGAPGTTAPGAPGAIAPVSSAVTAAPGSTASGGLTATVAPGTMAPVVSAVTAAPATGSEGSEVTGAPSAIAETPKDATATGAPAAASTLAPASAGVTSAPGAVGLPGLQGLPTAPPISMGADCWFECGDKAGACESFCGEGKACCRSGFSSDPEVCQGATGYTTLLNHQCVTVVSSTTTQGQSRPSMPGLAVRTPAPQSIGQHDQRAPPGYNHSVVNKTENATDGNGTLIAAADTMGGMSASWIWILALLLLLCCVPLLLYLLGCCGKAKKSKRGRKSKRSGRTETPGSDEDSFSAATSELEMETPLVQNQERSVNVSAGTMGGAADEGPDIFSQMDRDHDGVVTASEFYAAMGASAPAAATAPAAPAATLYTGAVASPGMVQQVASVRLQPMVSANPAVMTAAPRQSVFVQPVMAFQPQAQPVMAFQQQQAPAPINRVG